MAGNRPVTEDLDVQPVTPGTPTVRGTAGIEVNSGGRADIILRVGGDDLVEAFSHNTRNIMVDFTQAAVIPALSQRPEACRVYGSDRPSIEATQLPGGQMEIRIPTNTASAFASQTPGRRGAGCMILGVD